MVQATDRLVCWMLFGRDPKSLPPYQTTTESVYLNSALRTAAGLREKMT